MKRLTLLFVFGAFLALSFVSCSPRNKQKCDAYSKVELNEVAE